jgi:hypothetical protein
MTIYKINCQITVTVHKKKKTKIFCIDILLLFLNIYVTRGFDNSMKNILLVANGHSEISESLQCFVLHSLLIKAPVGGPAIRIVQ